MENVLADLALESEAATASALRLARAYDAPAGDRRRGSCSDLLTPIVKYWTCKRAPQHAAEALECLGGNGFVEESTMPRLFRQSPVNGVWEGSGNVICLDVLRALAREPDAIEAYWSEIGLAGSATPAWPVLSTTSMSTSPIPTRSRCGPARWSERMALVFQASLLVRHAPTSVADAFCGSRLGPNGSGTFGTLPAGTDLAGILARHTPV